MKRAVLDLGTNTFHLLIAERFEEVWRVCLRERRFVFLGENGLKVIEGRPLDRAIKTLEYYRTVLDENEVGETIVVTTEGVRKASNRDALLSMWSVIIGSPIQLLSGEEEAQWIARGVTQHLSSDQQNALIIDIGGGSVECIDLRGGSIQHLASYPVGLSVLYDKFHTQDPVHDQYSEKIISFIQATLFEGKSNFKINPPVGMLIGAAGSFEIFRPKEAAPSKLSRLRRSELEDRWNAIATLDENHRAVVPWIGKDRSKYILESLSIMRAVAQAFPQLPFYVSPNALKEGLLHS